jgi:hypothetical protein
MPAAVEQRKRFFIAGDHPAKQAVVGQFGGLGHLEYFDGPSPLSLHIPGKVSLGSRNLDAGSWTGAARPVLDQRALVQ